ncbi:kinase-like protein, partial [Macrolepiota fuliginosa MF-IS2]
LLGLLCELAKSAKVYPQCYVLQKGIQSDSQPIKGGGFADVYKGKHGSQTICLKVIRIFQKQESIDVLRECMKETVVCAHLSHPNILPFYGIYLFDDLSQRICLISPWMKNGNLWDYLKDNPSTLRTPLIMDIIKGLRYLHQLNIVHGDLKAQNILLSDDGRALITDFGLSHITVSSVGRKSSATSPGGTTRWTAPELLKGDDCHNQLTKACDIWSFGCLCYEVLTRKMPFYQYSREPQVIVALLKGSEVPIRPPPEAPCDEVDDCMWNLMSDCWNYQPQDRPTCDSIRDVLIGLAD